MGQVRPGRAGWTVAVVAVVATVVAGVGLRSVWMTPAAAIDVVAPVLARAEPVAARTGDPVTRWELTADGAPDRDTPLLVALATLPSDVTVEVRRVPGAGPGSWRRGSLLEVRREGHLDRACLRLRRPAGGVVRWELRGFRPPLRWPVGSGCDNVARDEPPVLVVHDGQVSAPVDGGRS